MCSEKCSAVQYVWHWALEDALEKRQKNETERMAMMGGGGREKSRATRSPQSGLRGTLPSLSRMCGAQKSRAAGGFRSRQQAGPVPQAACQEDGENEQIGAQHLVQQPPNRREDGGVDAALGRQARRSTLRLRGGAEG